MTEHNPYPHPLPCLVAPTRKPRGGQIWQSLRLSLLGSVLSCTMLLSACTTAPTASTETTVGTIASYHGRLSLHIDRQPPKSFFSNFHISGNAHNGTLQILSPFGSTLATAQWSRHSATLQQGSNIHTFDSLDDLLAKLTGAQLPAAALFDWLQGQNTAANGWQTDLSQYEQGKIIAWRTQPLPAAKLQLILQ